MASSTKQGVQRDSSNTDESSALKRSPWANSIAGLCAGMAGTITGHPFDTVKVRLQASRTGDMRGITRDLWRKEGLRGFYRGVTPPLLTSGILRSFVFSVYERTRAALGSTEEPGKRGGLDGVRVSFFAGVAGGLATSWATCPLELTKIQLQLHKETTTAGVATETVSPLVVVRGQLRQFGIRGMYHGFSLNAIRDGVGSGVYFAIYEVTRQFWQGGEAGSTAGLVSSFLSGGVSGMLTWLAIFPIDCVKTRLQREAHRTTKEFQGPLDCLVKIVRSEGIAALYRGIVPTLLRAFPIHSVVFLVYETAHIVMAEPPPFLE